MTQFILIAAFAVVLSWTAALAHKGHEHATGVVRERMELMTDMGERLLAISKRLRANKELAIFSSIRRSSLRGDWRTSCLGWERFVISCRLTNSTMRI